MSQERNFRCATEGVAKTTVPAMESKFDLTTAITAIFVAGYAAMLLDYLALDDLGLSTAQIRHMAVIAAAILGMGVAMGMLRSSPDRID